jgi:hypothetical protein
VSKWTFLPTFAELQAHTDEDLQERYDDATQAGQPVQATFALDELRRRESRRSEGTMRRLTWVITLLTAVNVAVVVVASSDRPSAGPRRSNRATMDAVSRERHSASGNLALGAGLI